jgi:hypothetical protein
LPAVAVENWVRQQVAALDPTVPVEVETLSERVSKMADRPRFETLLVGFFAATGLVMAVIGLYGVMGVSGDSADAGDWREDGLGGEQGRCAASGDG